jgi:2,3-bisphosphoglycerate-dependent phosphoglycerate mutase
LIAAFLRHGDYLQPENVPSAWLPYALTQNGEAQARRAARDMLKAVHDHDWRPHPVIDSSHLLRGWQTATLIAEELAQSTGDRVTVEAFDALAERSLGAAANLTVEEIEKIIVEDPRFDAPPRGWKSDSGYRLPLQGAESLIEAGGRVAEHVARRMDVIAAGGESGTMKIFVGHGGAFRHAAVHLGVLTAQEVARLSMHHCGPIYLETDGNGTWTHFMGPWKQRTRGEEAVD